MTNKLQISVDCLKNNNIYEFENDVTFEELNIDQEKDLIFTKPLQIKGTAYLAQDTLILTINIKFSISIPCSLCNEFFEKEIIINNFHLVENLKKINLIYDYKDEIRNACFLEIPSYVQCSEKCREKTNIKTFLNITKENFPFSNL